MLANGNTAIDGRLAFETSVLAATSAFLTVIGAVFSMRETW